MLTAPPDRRFAWLVAWKRGRELINIYRAGRRTISVLLHGIRIVALIEVSTGTPTPVNL
jgi:hypothetical protein